MDEAGRVRVAVVGCGRWGRNHVRNYAELGALRAVVDERPAAAAEASEAHGVPALSFDEALADSAIDALVFALPPSRNLPLGRRALEAGKHLFVEKPLALSVADGQALVDVAARLDRRLMVGHILQYHPAFIALSGLVREGRLGSLLSVVSSRLDLGRIRREEDALWALAPHDISMILSLVGAEPVSVAARGRYGTHPTIADVANVELGFAEGVASEIRVSWLNPFKEQRLVLTGRDVIAVFDDREPWERKLVLHPYAVTETSRGDPDILRGEAQAVALAPAEPLREECRHFLASVRDGVAPVTDGGEGVRVLSVLERASAALAASRCPWRPPAGPGREPPR